jgi:hypothetical protein
LYCDGNKFDCAALISKYGIENLEIGDIEIGD